MSIYRGRLGLGDIIAALEAEPDQERILPVGFHRPHSYRGCYDELAFEPVADVPVSILLEAARSALGTTYEGWKGGEYYMDEYTECWLADPGDSMGAQVSGLLLTLLLGADQLSPDKRDELVAVGAPPRGY